MRASDKRSGELFSYIDLEQRVRPDHPLRAIRSLTEAALASLSTEPNVRCAAGYQRHPPSRILLTFP